MKGKLRASDGRDGKRFLPNCHCNGRAVNLLNSKFKWDRSVRNVCKWKLARDDNCMHVNNIAHNKTRTHTHARVQKSQSGVLPERKFDFIRPHIPHQPEPLIFCCSFVVAYRVVCMQLCAPALCIELGFGVAACDFCCSKAIGISYAEKRTPATVERELCSYCNQ